MPSVHAPRRRRLAVIAAACAALAGGAAVAQAAPRPAASADQVQKIVTGPRYANTTWGIDVTDAVTGEQVYGLNTQYLYVPGSITKIFPGAAALDTIGTGYRFRTPVHRVGTVRKGVLDGELVLVGQGDFSFGLRDRKDGTLVYADGGADHNEANSLGLVTSVSGNPLKALNALAADVRKSGIRQVSDVVIDDRLFTTQQSLDGVITPIWVNENLIDITVTPTSAGKAAKMTYRPRTAAYTVTSTVKTGTETALSVDEPSPGKIEISGTVAPGSSAVRVWQVDDPASFARTAFIEALRRKGVAVVAEQTGPNPVKELPRKRTYPSSTRLGVWTSPTFDQYVKVVFKVSYNRGADLLACLVGVKAGIRSCDGGLGVVNQTVQGWGVPGNLFFNFDGAGSNDANKHSTVALAALNKAASLKPWAAVYKDALPQLGTPGGGDLASFGAGTPIAGKLRAKTGTRAGGPPGAPAAIMGQRGLSGYLTGASGREYLITIMANNTQFTSFDDIFAVIEDQVAIVQAIYNGT